MKLVSTLNRKEVFLWSCCFFADSLRTKKELGLWAGAKKLALLDQLAEGEMPKETEKYKFDSSVTPQIIHLPTK